MSAAAAIAHLFAEVQDFVEGRRDADRLPCVRVEQDSQGQRRRVHTFTVVVDARVVATASATNLERAAKRTLEAFEEWTADQPNELAAALEASVMSLGAEAAAR